MFTAALYSCEEIVRPYSRQARVTGRSSSSCSGSSSWSSDFTPQMWLKQCATSAGNGSSMSSTSCPSEASSAETSSHAATQAGSGVVPLAVAAYRPIRSRPGSRPA